MHDCGAKCDHEAMIGCYATIVNCISSILLPPFARVSLDGILTGNHLVAYKKKIGNQMVPYFYE
ncbi:hypothetical protein GGD46_002247 [Rhizobium lusitanum]|uniref:Uncharacterized protein n=1 Tax=Rhizobium lusitanum TaxID=293958 RepID=A0A7X0IS33_9HYPH|nr:hypothetical protein [Rhizobium lusitanum]